jgi:hypothetical protein
LIRLNLLLLTRTDGSLVLALNIALLLNLVLLVIALLIPAGWRGRLARIINRALVAALKVALLLDVILLIVTLIPAGGCGRVAAIVRGALIAALAAIAPIVRPARFADNIAHRASSELRSGGATNRIHAGASIRIDSALMTVEIDGLALEVSNYPRAVDNPGVIPNQITAIETIVETMDVAEDEKLSI